MSKLTKPFNIEPYSLVKTANDINQIPFGKLIGNILSACVDAQSNASDVAWNYTQKVLMHSETPMVFTYQDPEKVVRRIEVPLVTIVPLPYMRLDNVDIDFDASVNVLNQANEKLVVNSNNVEITGAGTKTEKLETNMHININASTTDMPAGLAALLHLINGGIVIEKGIHRNTPSRPRPFPTPTPLPRPLPRPGSSRPGSSRPGSSRPGSSRVGSLRPSSSSLFQSFKGSYKKTGKIRYESAGVVTEIDLDFGSVPGMVWSIDEHSKASALKLVKEGVDVKPKKTKVTMKAAKATKPTKATKSAKPVEAVEPLAYNGNPLLALHVFWTRPFLMGNTGWEFDLDDFEVISTVLSALLWRKYNGPIKLYTDKEGLDYYNRLGMIDLWNGGIDIATLSKIPETIPADIFWAAGKIFAIKKEKAPFVVMDTDLMVWDSIAPYIEGNKLMAYHSEDLFDCYLPYEQLKKPANYTLNRKWDWTLKPYNTALTYFADDEATAKFKKDYTQKAIKFMTNNTERPADTVSQMVFAEQRLFAMIAKLHVGYPIPTFLEYIDQQDRPFTHLWGSKFEARTNDEAQHNLCVSLGQALRQNFPDEHFSAPIEDILKKYC